MAEYGRNGSVGCCGSVDRKTPGRARRLVAARMKVVNTGHCRRLTLGSQAIRLGCLDLVVQLWVVALIARLLLPRTPQPSKQSRNATRMSYDIVHATTIAGRRLLVHVASQSSRARHAEYNDASLSRRGFGTFALGLVGATGFDGALV
jgi:hypothetical protein